MIKKKERFKITPLVYLVLINKNKVLLSRRFNTGFGDGEYNLPAGHVDGNETLNKAIVRETKEEIGINLNQEHLKLVHVMHRKKQSGKERIDFFFVTEKWQGEPKIMEPDKCDDLGWFDLDNLPKNVSPYVKKAISSIKNNIFYSDEGF